MAAQIHYCGGEFENISIGYEESTKCCCDSKSSCKDCCKNEHFKPSVSKHFSANQQINNTPTFITLQAIQYPELLVKLPIIQNEAYSSLPFKDYNLPDFIRNCVYRL